MLDDKLADFTSCGRVTGSMRYDNFQYIYQVRARQDINLRQDQATPLSRRQTEVLQLLVQGYANKQIARALGLATGTVKIHVGALFHKLGVTSRLAAAVAGVKLLAAAAQPPPAGLDDRPIRSTHAFGPSRLGIAA